MSAPVAEVQAGMVVVLRHFPLHPELGGKTRPGVVLRVAKGRILVAPLTSRHRRKGRSRGRRRPVEHWLHLGLGAPSYFWSTKVNDVPQSMATRFLGWLHPEDARGVLARYRFPDDWSEDDAATFMANCAVGVDA